MADDSNKIHLPEGDVNPDDLTTGGLGAGSSDTDTGGLTPDGTELGAASPGSDHGLTTAQDEKQHEQGARNA
jgi:hypothetical protein